MKEVRLDTNVKVYAWEELTKEESSLVDAAKEATRQAYAPYSSFCVGTAVLLENGVVVTGSNQENAAYPSGLCAERVALFHANHQYPHTPVVALAIAARNGDSFVDAISPCGACRQVLLEVEQRYGKPMKVLLYGSKEIWVVDSAESLLPLCFGVKNLE